MKQAPDEFSENVDKGLVLHQNPKPNGRIRKGGTVTVVLSAGKDRRRVPRLVGTTFAAATQALLAIGLKAAPTPQLEYNDTVPKDAVIRSDPAAGFGAKPGAVITLYISRGPPPVNVPDVRGNKQGDAEAVLRDAGFTVASTMVFSDTVHSGLVVDQSPSSGTADKGSTVTLTVSKGPDVVAVPDVRGDSPSDATRKLEQVGLKADPQTIPGGPGIVIQTDPRPGKKVRRGTTVILYIF